MELRVKIAALGLALVICLIERSAFSREPVNLISNGGFEEGLRGWNADPRHSLVTETGTAHAGTAALSGEVTKPSEALFLRRSVQVTAGNRYLFEIWARATKRTKLVLWVIQPDSRARQMVASWPKVPGRWRRYTTPLTVRGTGKLELQIVAPSSHGEPPGRIWIDDVALYETEMPPVLSVSEGVGFNDEPSVATAPDGLLYAAWNSFRAGADSLQLARYAPQDRSYARRGAWQILGGEGCHLLGVRTVSTDRGVAVLYASEKGGRWNIHVVRCGPDGPGRPVAVTSGASVDVKPVAVSHDSTLWIAWESNRNGWRQIFSAFVRGDDVSEPIPLSQPGASSYDPSITALPGGEICVAWHSFRKNNYDIYLRRRTSRGSWGPEIRLTRAPTIDRHPLLFAHGQDLWLAYENAQVSEYRIGTTNRRRVAVAKVTPSGLMTPKLGGDSPLDDRCEAPDAKFDSSGRLWLAFLKPRLPRAGWDVYVTCYAGNRWQPPVPVSLQKGMDRRPSLAVEGTRGTIAFQSDTIPNSWSDVDRTPEATSDIFLVTIDLAAVKQHGAMELQPITENAEPFEPAELRVARGEDTPTPTISYKDETLKLFYGDLHEHTDLSVCNRAGDQSINESYQHMRDIARHDFACTTDHGYNINPYLWSYTAKMVRVNDDPDRFLTFLAEEWTSSFEKYDTKHPYGYYGHRNLILADTYFPRWWNARNGQTPAQVWEELRRMQANFVHIPHQLADTGNVPTDWDFTDEKAQPVAEIFQVRGSYEYKGAPREAKRTTPQPGYFLQDAWARGIVIGVIASPDHGGGYGKACVYAPELTREAILDAIRRRHCYGTTGAKIFLDVRVNDHLMGEKITAPAGKAVNVTIRTRCPGEIERVEVCRNNRFVYTKAPDGREAELTFTDQRPLEGRSYYYVRVIQKDQEIAWSSPVWLLGSPVETRKEKKDAVSPLDDE